jgi:hypothetical protein
METTRRTNRTTQELPAVETLADIYATDPERIFTHRHEPVTRPARNWSAAGLDRLLSDLEETR